MPEMSTARSCIIAHTAVVTGNLRGDRGASPAAAREASVQNTSSSNCLSKGLLQTHAPTGRRPPASIQSTPLELPIFKILFD